MAKRKFVPEFGQGTFYEERIGDKKYFVYEWCTPDKRRNPRKRFPYTKEGEKERELFAKDIISKMNAGVQTRSTETFGEWLLYYLSTYRKANVDPDTFNRFLQYANNIPTSVANTLLDKLKGEQLQEMITGMLTDPCYRRDGKKKPLSNSTVKKIYELIFACLDKARVLHKIRDNPMESVDKPTNTEQQKKQAFSREELKLFYKALIRLTKSKNRGRIRKDYKTLFFMLYALGLRIGELLAIQHKDVDLTKEVVYITKSKKSNKTGQIIKDPKTEKGKRTIPILFDSAYNRLSKMQEQAEDKNSFLFPTSSGKALGYFQVERVFLNACKLAGIKGRTIHELRHTFGSNMAKALGRDGKPIPIAELSRIMGHSKISTTQNFYVHSDEAQNEELLKSFANPQRRKKPKTEEKK